jgi:GTP pyrophosphokinase
MIAADEIGLGVRSTICALLHDTVEDTDITLDDIRREFGNEIAKIVDGLTKIANVMDTNSSQQAENFKKNLTHFNRRPEGHPNQTIGQATQYANDGLNETG